MVLHHLQHFLVQTRDLRGTADWYVNVLGLREGQHPDFGFPVVWLYLGEQDVLHLTEGGSGVSAERLAYLGQQSQALEGSGVIDHVAFRASGLQEMTDHLDELGVSYTKRQVNEGALIQLFLHDPNGVKVELNFEVGDDES